MINYIIGVIGVAVLGYIAWLKSRVTKVTKEKDNAIIEREVAEIKVTVGQKTDKIKDELVESQRELTKEKEEVVKEVTNVEGDPLDEAIKKLSADQSARAKQRADRLSERSSKD